MPPSEVARLAGGSRGGMSVPSRAAMGPGTNPSVQATVLPADTFVLCRDRFRLPMTNAASLDPALHVAKLPFDYANAVPWWGLVTAQHTGHHL